MVDVITNVSHAAAPLAQHEHGFWGPATATLDWCEENYQFSHYIAEVANSFSNLVTVWFALHGARKAVENRLPGRLWLAQLGFALVGIGSFAFHATMLYEAQLADELPMIYIATYSMYILFDTEPGWSISSRRSSTLLGLLLGFNTAFTAAYYAYRNPIYHQVVFAILILTTGFRVTHLVRWSPRYSARIPLRIRTEIFRMFWTGGGLFILGFIIWNLDNVFCTTLTRWKVAIGWPVAFLLEGHSWWHVLTAVGTYLMIQGIAFVTLCVKDDHRKFEIAYDMGIPNIARVETFPSKTKAEK